MKPVLPLDEMTILEKVATMEELWDDLCRTPEEVTSPSWHEEILIERKNHVNEGTARFSDLAQVKERIRHSRK